MNQLLVSLGITLVHSLWESAVIWLVLRLTLSWLRDASGATRYTCSALALLAALVAPVATFAWLEFSPPPDGSAAPVLLLGRLAGGASAGEAMAHARWEGKNLIFALLVFGWLVGCAGKGGLLLRDLIVARRLSRTSLAPLGALEEVCWANARSKFPLRQHVRVGYSRLIDVPSVVGWLKPAVLFPFGALAGLSPSQIESLFAHELAHLRRNDFVVNLVQVVGEMIYFFNPATLALSRAVRCERELACDELAVAAIGDPRGLAQALAQLEESRQLGLALAAGGSGHLLARIQRLVSPPGTGRRAPLTGFAVASLGLIYFGLFALIPLVATNLKAGGPTNGPAALVAAGGSADLGRALDAAARAWLGALDDGQFDLAYANAGIWLHAQSTDSGSLGAVTVKKWKTLGRCTSRTAVAAIRFESEPHGAFQGEWAYAKYRAAYEHAGAQLEMVQFQKEPDGNWRVAGFSIGEAR